MLRQTKSELDPDRRPIQQGRESKQAPSRKVASLARALGLTPESKSVEIVLFGQGRATRRVKIADLICAVREKETFESAAQDRRLLQLYHRLIDRQLEGTLSPKDKKELQRIEKKLQAREDAETSQIGETMEQRHRVTMEKLDELTNELRNFALGGRSPSQT